MDAATAKRKRPATNVTGDASASASPSAAAKAGAEEVSDAEVEEFYAILRRMRDASRRLCGAAGARPPARAPAWRPSFSWEDFAAVPAAPARRPRPDHTDDDDTAAPPPRAGGLDLNVEPEPDEPSFSASAPATPRSARAPA